MPCPSQAKKDLAQVTLSEGSTKVVKPRREPKKRYGTADFYCDRCGLTRFNANQPYKHICDPKNRNKSTFVDLRRTICDACPQNVDGVCQPLKDQGLPGVIDVGLPMFKAVCPNFYWLAVRVSCPICGHDTCSLKGVDRCESCGWQGEEIREIEQPKLEDIVLVTSFGPYPNHVESQQRCLESWKAAGFDVYAVNSTDEIETLKDQYAGLNWIANDDLTEAYQVPTQRISNLVKVAADLGKTILLTNSDIEIHGSQNTLLNVIAPNTLSIGIRYNYKTTWQVGRREQWGLDAFLITPEMAKQVPRMGFGIGRPVWDYWLPIHFRSLGYRVNAIGSPFFYHKTHPLNWDRGEWSIGADWVKANYEERLTDRDSSVRFRNRLPFPPNPPRESGRPRILFHHIAKTAGSTVTEWLKKNFDPAEQWQTRWDAQAQSVSEYAAMPKDQKEGIYLITGHSADACLKYAPSDIFSITVLREPIDRMVSYYYFHLEKGLIDESKPIVDFVRENPNRDDYKRLGGVRIMNTFNVVGFQDMLPEFCLKVMRHTGLKIPFQDQRTNVTKSRLQVNELDPGIIRDLKKLLTSEIEIYDSLRSRIKRK